MPDYYDKFPPLAQWKKDSFVGTALFPRRADDIALIAIDTLLEYFPKSETKGALPLYVAAEIFFTSMWWLNNFKSQPKKMDGRRRPAILQLNVCAANQVARLLRCPLGQVASKLKAIYGTKMTQFGADKDREFKVHYLTLSERERFRIIFIDGKGWWRTSTKSGAPLELFDTTDMKTEGRPGLIFVMTVSGGFFVSQLCNDSNMVKFHSCFMGGAPILGAGTVSALRGQIIRIKNDSGHYRPQDPTQVWVLQKLKFNGVDISKVLVEREPKFKGGPQFPSMFGDKYSRAMASGQLDHPQGFGLPKVA